jgi:hypothetical protein
VLHRDVGVDVVTEWMRSGERDGEDASRLPRIACRTAQRGSQPNASRGAAKGDARQRRKPGEEPLDTTFANGGCSLLNTADDADIVGSVPGACGGPRMKSRCAVTPGPLGSTGIAEGERAGFSRIAQQPFIQGTPPWAARPEIALRVEKPSPQLPTHEGRCRPPVGKVSTIHTARHFIQSAQQRQACRRVVPDTLYC